MNPQILDNDYIRVSCKEVSSRKPRVWFKVSCRQVVGETTSLVTMDSVSIDHTLSKYSVANGIRDTAEP